MSRIDLTPEELYRAYHRETNLAAGRVVKTVNNFDKAKNKPEWQFFIHCTNVINRNSGQIDYKIYMKSLAEHHKGWFKPDILGSTKSLAIYKQYIRQLENDSSVDYITKSLLQSINFVIKYCKENEITSFEEYLNKDINLIPIILKHYNAGSISLYFLSSISDFREICSSYPQDCVFDYLADIDNKYSTYRIRVLSIERLKNIVVNLEQIINTKINDTSN